MCRYIPIGECDYLQFVYRWRRRCRIDGNVVMAVSCVVATMGSMAEDRGGDGLMGAMAGRKIQRSESLDLW